MLLKTITTKRSRHKHFLKPVVVVGQHDQKFYSDFFSNPHSNIIYFSTTFVNDVLELETDGFEDWNERTDISNEVKQKLAGCMTELREIVYRIKTTS